MAYFYFPGRLAKNKKGPSAKLCLNAYSTAESLFLI